MVLKLYENGVLLLVLWWW